MSEMGEGMGVEEGLEEVCRGMVVQEMGLERVGVGNGWRLGLGKWEWRSGRAGGAVGKLVVVGGH